MLQIQHYREVFASRLVHRFRNMVAYLLQPYSGEGGFETRPYICCSGTSAATINAPPQEGWVPNLPSIEEGSEPALPQRE